MLGQRIYQARMAAGLTLEALGECLGVTKTAIQKYEKGKTTPDSAKLLKIARACGVRTEYFFRTQAVELENVEFRKTSTFGKKRQQAVQIRVAEMVEKRVELLNVFPEPPVPSFTLPSRVPEHIDDLDALEEVASQLRHHWDLGLNPISDLTDTLESLGILVMALDFDAQGFVGMTATAHTVDGRRYTVIAVSSQWPGDRQRFTLAHELAHMLLAGRLAEEIDEEKACDQGACLAGVLRFQLIGRQGETHLGGGGPGHGLALTLGEALHGDLGDGQRCLEVEGVFALEGLAAALELAARATRARVIAPGSGQRDTLELVRGKWHPVPDRAAEHPEGHVCREPGPYAARLDDIVQFGEVSLGILMRQDMLDGRFEETHEAV
ncbi:XRE family transcriptional regulator [Halomonas sp.]|uniref:XRE family transcriptional regulator n=1 Tax=Halomonas sp. TaxID=1486246 RepID=UPI0023539335|nr:XRE family transcriptional regulator [Halomonas sp.]